MFFPLVAGALGVIPNKLMPNPRSQPFTLCLLLGVLQYLSKYNEKNALGTQERGGVSPQEMLEKAF